MISSSRRKVRNASGSEKLCVESAAVLGLAPRMSVLQGERQDLPPSVRVQILDYKNTQLPWGGYPETRTYLSIIYEREKFAPYGMTVAIQRSFDGSPFATETTFALLTNSTDQAGENSLHNLTSSLASDILSSVSRTGRVPDKLWATARSLPVLVMRPEPYLEGGFIC
ncbi:hypothetical protein UY3_08217 [Chelonia mydas]|uniref:Uncharacterized protein n=1 Tax=Chelonia mydas TaxID=8469 RepID=M7BG99_CHEMY|nr:hypothetical protein UY3_08217 [Chelonia mydas]